MKKALIAAAALVAYIDARSGNDLVVETIDGHPASGSRHVDALLLAGFRRGTVGLRHYRRSS